MALAAVIAQGLKLVLVAKKEKDKEGTIIEVAFDEWQMRTSRVNVANKADHCVLRLT